MNVNKSQIIIICITLEFTFDRLLGSKRELTNIQRHKWVFESVSFLFFNYQLVWKIWIRKRKKKKKTLPKISSHLSPWHKSDRKKIKIMDDTETVNLLSQSLCRAHYHFLPAETRAVALRTHTCMNYNAVEFNPKFWLFFFFYSSCQ